MGSVGPLAAISGASTIGNIYETERQMDAQAAEAERNRQFSKEMYELQHENYLKDYPELQKIQADTQFNLWKNQFDVQSAYNNTSNQVARNLVAGVNPAGQSGLVTGSATNMGASGSVSPPPVISGSPLGGSVSPIGLPFNNANIGELLRDLGSYKRDIADASKTDKEVSRYDELLDSQIELNIQKAASEQAYADYQDTQNQILKCFGYKQAAQNVVKTYQECYKLKTEGKYNEALEKLAESQKLLNDDKHAINKPYVEKANEMFELNRKALQADIRQKNSSSFEASMRGKLEGEQAETIRQLRPYEVDLRKYQSQTQKYVTDSEFWRSLMEHDNAVVSKSTIQERIKLAVEEAENKGLLNNELGYRIQTAAANAEYAEMRELLGVVEQGVAIGTNVSRAKSLNQLATQQEIHNQINAEYFRYKMMPKKHESYTDRYDSDGNHLGSIVTRRYDE